MKRPVSALAALTIGMSGFSPAQPAAAGSPSAAAAEAGDSTTVFYKIVSRAGGGLLSALGGGTADGTAGIVHRDVGASDQLWTIERSDLGYVKLINKRSGRALSTVNGATADGTPAHLWRYLSTAPDQDWTVTASGAGHVRISNRKRPSAVLSVAGSGADNSRVQVRAAAGAAGQDWQIVPVQTFDPDKLYTIVNHNSRTALSVLRGATGNNAVADLYEQINQPDQFWRIVDNGDGWYHVVNHKSGRLLSLLGGQTTNGTRAMIYDDVDATDQGWAIRAGADGLYRLSNQRRPSGVLSVVGAATARESPAQIWDDIGARDQTWEIAPVGNTIAVNALNAEAAPISRRMTGSGLENVNHEIYGGLYSQLIYGEVFGEPAVEPGVSGQWRRTASGTATGSLSLTTDRPFRGAQSQRITYTAGSGRFGVDNRGLNRWGINLIAGRPYEGYVYLRTPGPAVTVTVSGEGGSSTVTARGDWAKYPFTFTPATSNPTGAVSITLNSPGTADLGYVFVQPGSWGRFRDLPVRKDIADALADQRVSVLRFGGLAVNVPGYRWKNMIGPRENRPILNGFWSTKVDTHGWGIIEFLNLCEAMGISGIPTLNIDETPADLADFVDYLKAPVDTYWGAQRAADGHPAPYRVDHLELGNEQRVDDAFAAKFVAGARAIWAKDPTLTLTVGDFSYEDVIADPERVTGAHSGLTSLSAYRSILDATAAAGGRLAIDLHVWTSDPYAVPHLVDAVDSFDTWVHRYRPDVDYRINILELNADQHDVSRALANAVAIGAFESLGNRVSVVTSANALQPDGQNDDGWDQGLVFFDTRRSWLQPPGHVTRMIAESYLPTAVAATTSNPALHVTAKTDGTTLQLQVVNSGPAAQTPAISLNGFRPTAPTMRVTQLQGARGDRNDAANVTRVVPVSSTPGTTLDWTFPANSFTVLRLQ
ncbi:RICIN domain-containing protein [Actinoplanes sp. M2I2]|uniref:RICIN domain-containing protein n=1 Tax=Actinoplanes sp. M2I2 TaxID=1734444 RepID=UPI00201FD2E2|nr:RICIN domain-containing protein [Actinoplanes sp. M2I2]